LGWDGVCREVIDLLQCTPTAHLSVDTCVSILAVVTACAPAGVAGERLRLGAEDAVAFLRGVQEGVAARLTATLHEQINSEVLALLGAEPTIGIGRDPGTP
jgi:hypothetical protein